MADGYYNIYLKRLNRYGENYQTRVQSKREEEFETYLLKSVYRVVFEFEEEMHPGTFEKYKQDETETLHYLLTRRDLNISNGTILMLPDKDENLHPWMVYYLEAIKASGYNRYVLLKMTHFLTWLDKDNNPQETWAYFFGQQDNALKDELQSGARSNGRYTEPIKSSFFIMPLNRRIKKDTYFEIGEGDLKEGYRVTGYDIQSTLGVEYVTVDPVYLMDTTPLPPTTISDDDEDLFWLRGGK